MKKEMNNNLLNNTFSCFNFHKDNNLLFPVNNSMSTLSTSQMSFFSHKTIFTDKKLLETVFKNNSYEIFQFLEKEDIENLEKTNKFFLDICDCYLLFDNSIKSLGKLFAISINEDNKKVPEKKSKVREKYNFKKTIGEYYKKKDDSYFNRIYSEKKNKNK